MASRVPPCPNAPKSGHIEGSPAHLSCPYCNQKLGKSGLMSWVSTTPPLAEGNDFDDFELRDFTRAMRKQAKGRDLKGSNVPDASTVVASMNQALASDSQLYFALDRKGFSGPREQRMYGAMVDQKDEWLDSDEFMDEVTRTAATYAEYPGFRYREPDSQGQVDELIRDSLYNLYERHQDDKINEDGESPELIMRDGQVMSQGAPEGDFYAIEVHLPEDAGDEERQERIGHILNYAARASHRGEGLGVSFNGRIATIGHDSTKARTSSDHSDEFARSMADMLNEGSPVRKTDRAGAGTKGTRAVEGLGITGNYHIYYD